MTSPKDYFLMGTVAEKKMLTQKAGEEATAGDPLKVKAKEQEKDENCPAPLTPDLSELAQGKEQEKDENCPAPLTPAQWSVLREKKREMKLAKKLEKREKREKKLEKRRCRMFAELRKYQQIEQQVAEFKNTICRKCRQIEQQVAEFGAYIQGVRGDLEEELKLDDLNMLPMDSDSSQGL